MDHKKPKSHCKFDAEDCLLPESLWNNLKGWRKQASRSKAMWPMWTHRRWMKGAQQVFVLTHDFHYIQVFDNKGWKRLSTESNWERDSSVPLHHTTLVQAERAYWTLHAPLRNVGFGSLKVRWPDHRRERLRGLRMLNLKKKMLDDGVVVMNGDNFCLWFSKGHLEWQ